MQWPLLNALGNVSIIFYTFVLSTVIQPLNFKWPSLKEIRAKSHGNRSRLLYLQWFPLEMAIDGRSPIAALIEWVSCHELCRVCWIRHSKPERNFNRFSVSHVYDSLTQTPSNTFDTQWIMVEFSYPHELSIASGNWHSQLFLAVSVSHFILIFPLHFANWFILFCLLNLSVRSIIFQYSLSHSHYRLWECASADCVCEPIE